LPVHAAIELRPRAWQAIDLARLFQYRELLWYMALRDVQVRYKQTLLGAAWAIVQPVAMMLVFTVLVGRMLGVAERVDGVPYPIFVFAGLLPWTFFAAAINASTHSLVNNAAMLRKIYFPRLILPLAAIGAPLVDFALSMLVLVGLLAWYTWAPGAQMLLLPLLVALTILSALGVGIGLSALTVRYRDFRYVVTFLLQIWFFLTPVIYPVSLAPDKWRWVLMLNPIGGTIEGFRAAVLGRPIDWTALAASAAVSAACLAAGLALFARAERRMADVV
jgi:lipopolysaccharide transport system permease protein